MNEGLRIGVLLPTREAHLTGTSARPLVDIAVAAEDLGFDSVWAGDSLTARPRVEPLTFLAAVAAATSRITLGTAALIAPLRNPVLTAHAIATLDQLAEGRLVLGLGAGFPMPDTRAEFELVGAPFERRVTRLMETVTLWRSLWADETGTLPRPTRPGGPPLWLAGAGPAARTRTGRHFDGWLPYPPTATAYADGLATVQQSARDAGRTPDDLTPALYLTVLVDESGRAHDRLDRYAHSYYGFGADALRTMQAVAVGPAETCSTAIAAYVDAGARHLIVRIATLDPREHLDQLSAIRSLTMLETTR